MSCYSCEHGFFTAVKKDFVFLIVSILFVVVFTKAYRFPIEEILAVMGWITRSQTIDRVEQPITSFIKESTRR